MALSLEQYLSRHDNGDYTLKHILTKRIERQRKKSLGVSIKIGNEIPEHLIIEILSWLPVKSLLQFKTVCKSWYNIIKSSHFISKHLRNYYDNDNNWRNCLIVPYAITPAGEINVYELLIDGTKNRTLAYQRIDTPGYSSYFCGPCDGIYFFSYCKPSLWNPALNEFIELPDITWKPGNNIPPDWAQFCQCFGFGYDSKTKDYKVIQILGYSDDRDEYSYVTDNPMSILIYSLRGNCWRYWGDMDNSYDFEPNSSYVFVNGCYYWLASRLLDHYGWDFQTIVSFDISGETCQEISLPQFESMSKPSLGSQLIVYQDSIAFVSVPDVNTSFCVWTWNEGVWTQKLSMKLESGVHGAISGWRDNSLVFGQVYKKLALCDGNTKEIFDLDDREVGSCESIWAYKESLVSIKDFEKDIKHKGSKNR